MPEWVRQLWFPANFRVLELLYNFAGILWLVIVGTNIAEQLGFMDRN